MPSCQPLEPVQKDIVSELKATERSWSTTMSAQWNGWKILEYIAPECINNTTKVVSILKSHWNSHPGFSATTVSTIFPKKGGLEMGQYLPKTLWMQLQPLEKGMCHHLFRRAEVLPSPSKRLKPWHGPGSSREVIELKAPRTLVISSGITKSNSS